jgi:hypothetical protein
LLLRRLNTQGIELFTDYLNLLGPDSGAAIPPRGLLTRSDTSIKVSPSVEIDPAPIESRLNAAQSIADLLSPLPPASRFELESDRGFWAWLSLYYFDSVCPLRKGSRTPGHPSRHVIGEKGRNKYRHLLASPYTIYSSFRPAHLRAMAALYTPVHTPGEIAEQITGSQNLVSIPNVVEAYTSLYFDASKNWHKPGAAGAGRGSSRRMSVVLNQFDRTFDLGSMTAQQILDLLPVEFDRFK